MRKILTLVVLAILFLPMAGWAVNLCAITGQLQNPDGSNCANCTLTVNSIKPQTVSGQIINPVLISTTTDSNGNLNSFNVAQGLAVQFIISTATGTTSAPFTAIIPFSTTVSFSQLAVQSNVTGSFHLNDLQPATGTVNFNGQRAINLGLNIANADALSQGQSKTSALADVCSTPPTDDQILAYDSTLGQYCPMTGSPSGVSEGDVNGIIDLCAHGFGCNAQFDNTGVTLNNGSATITLSGAAGMGTFSSNMCHGGTGCTGTTNYVVKVYDTDGGGGHVDTFIGTLTAFTSSTVMTLSSNYQGTNTTGAFAVWGSPDSAAATALQTLLNPSGGTNRYPRKIWCHAPILEDTTLDFNLPNVDFEGTGHEAHMVSNTDENLNGCIIIDMNPTPDVPMVVFNGAVGSKFHRVAFEGSVLDSPSSMLALTQNFTGPTLTSTEDRVEDISDSFQTFLFPLANWGLTKSCTPTGTTFSGSSVACNATNPGLHPNQNIYIFDPVTGPERHFTSPSYTTGGTTITLFQGNPDCTAALEPRGCCTGNGTGSCTADTFQATHTNANLLNGKIYYYPNPAAQNFVHIDAGGSQNDQQGFDGIYANWVDTGLEMDQQQSVQDVYKHVFCTNCATAFAMPFGGEASIEGMQQNNTSIGLFLDNNARITVKDYAQQPSALANLLTGSMYQALFGGQGGWFDCLGCYWSQTSKQNSNGDIVSGGPSTTRMTIDEKHWIISVSQILPTPGVQIPTVHAFFSGSTFQDVDLYMDPQVASGGNFWASPQYVESGTQQATAIRQICTGRGVLAQSPDMAFTPNCTTLVGTQSYDATQHDIAAHVHASELNAIQVSGITPGPGTCSDASTTTDYYFWTTAIINGHESTVGGRSAATPCDATLNSTSFIKFNVSDTSPYIRTLNGYVASVGHGSPAPTPGAALLFQTVNAATSAVSSAGTFANAVGFIAATVVPTPGTSPPVFNSTGEVNAGGLVTASSGLLNNCNWNVTLASGVGSTNVACLSQFSRVAYGVGLSSPTGAVTTPTATAVSNVFCAQTAANSTTVACTSASGADSRPVYGVGY